VLKKTEKVNYLIDMHDRSKRRRVYHVNLLKEWETPVTDCFFFVVVVVFFKK